MPRRFYENISTFGACREASTTMNVPKVGRRHSPERRLIFHRRQFRRGGDRRPVRDLARISHTPSVVSQNAAQESIFPQALAAVTFGWGFAGLNQLRRAPKMAGTIFSFVPRLIFKLG